MMNLIGGFWIARSLYLAAQVGVADAFDDQPKTIAQLAEATNTEPRYLWHTLACSLYRHIDRYCNQVGLN
ncbi:MAG: hypothetical protein ACAF41_01375 [Leptolyngbya sp. BL-A-14]